MQSLDALPNLSEQQKYYTDRWGRFDHANSIELARIAKVFDFMAEIPLAPRLKICDFGCGAGWSTNLLNTFGETTGVDLSDVRDARARYPACTFISADVLAWNAPSEEFDLVVSMEVLEHIDTLAQSKYLSAALRILKPRGHLILTTPHRRTMEAIPGGGRTWTNQPLENWLSARQLKTLLCETGFQVLSMTSVVLGVASLGRYRIVNSAKLSVCLEAAGLLKPWREWACRSLHGVHLAVLARKP